MSSEVSINDSIEVSIEKMVYGGEGLSRTSGGVLLTPRVISGERTRVEAEPARRGVRRGRLLEVLEMSPDRVGAECPFYKQCGGCQYQHISYSRQLQIKQEILAECFQRIGKVKLDVPIQTLSSEPWHYRNRIRLQVEKNSAGLRIGYFAHASHTLVPIDRCPIALPSLERVVSEVARGVLAEAFPDGLCELELFSSNSGTALLATVYSAQGPPPGLGDGWRAALPEFESVCWAQAIPRKPESTHDTLWGTGSIIYRMGDLHYRVSHHSFFQANAGLLQSMIEAAVNPLTGSRALDLYAGVGLFTVPLSRRFERVGAVEAHRAAAADLAANIGVAGTRAQAHHKTAEQFLATTSRNWDAVLVDPPRNGLTKPVLEGLRRLRPAQIAYISCDPTTLARDVASLCSDGYEIRSVHLADQFPQTFHIETIVHLARRS